LILALSIAFYFERIAKREQPGHSQIETVL
jgi:hypothetical protein